MVQCGGKKWGILNKSKNRSTRTQKTASHKMPRFPLILGLSWLTLHNPLVDWTQQKLQFRDPCPHLAFPSASAIVMALARPVSLLSTYADFADIFEEQGADKLPLYRPYDSPIDFIPEAPLLVGPLYPMSKLELKALWELIQQEPAARVHLIIFFLPSALVLFVKNNSRELCLCNGNQALNKITM